MLPLERPVLSLTIDAVVNMNGEDALCGLLTLFHKCREGLQDGDRLENMAWRLWHVERASSNICYSSSSALPFPDLVASPLTSSSSSCSEGESEVSSDGETWDQDQAATKQQSGATNDKADNFTLSKSLSPLPGAPPGTRRQSLNREQSNYRSPSLASAASRKTSRSRRPSLSSRRTHSNTSIGQIMADLLPEKLDLYRSPSLNTLPEKNNCLNGPLTAPDNGEHVPAVTVVLHAQLEQPQAQPSSPQVDRSMRFPTVVIVNPTPHPTPPRSPQVSPPPTSPPISSGLGLMPKRDTLTVDTHLCSPTSPTLPPTPESIAGDEVKPSLLPSASGPRSGIGRAASNNCRQSGSSGAGKSAVLTGPSSVLRLGAAEPGINGYATGSSINPPDRKFFISQAGSPDGDSPATSASSQVGPRSAISASVAPSSVLDKRVEEEVAACVPASVASHRSTGTAHSHSSNGTSSRGTGTQVKDRKGAGTMLTTKGKGKAKETRPALSAMHRAHSSNRIHRLQAGPGGLTGGTIQRSKLGGRTAAASAHATTTLSQFGQQQSIRNSGIAMQPPQPAPVSRLAQAEKPTATSSSTARPGPSARRQSSSSRKSSRSGSSAKRAKPTGQGLPSSSLRPARLDFADDSDYTTESEEWDTEDASEEVDGTSGENERIVTDHKLAEAAEEAQRQRNMFAKLDRSSYADLTRVRSQPGLLSAMFHPDPELFPADHPYRHTRSTQDILAHVSRPSFQAAPLQPSRSSAAAPVAATVTAQGVGSPSQTNSRQRSPLRLRGRPQDVEESDSGEDEEENSLHISASVAEQRLAMLHRQHAGNRPRQSSRLAQESSIVQPPTEAPTVIRAAPARPAVPMPLSRVATEPVPLGYPYNLPPPIPPSTPRTTRRMMLTNELSESLRRNLLWERQVSKQRPMGLGRRAVTNASAAGPSNLRPLTTTTGPSQNMNPNGNAPQGNGSGANHPTSDTASGAQTEEEERMAREEREQQVLARNRSWADTFHTSGW